MNNKEFGKELELRTKKFAISILKLSALLPNSTEAKVIKNQISKSETSVGANYRESNRARSKLILRIRLRYVRQRLVKQLIGLN